MFKVCFIPDEKLIDYPGNDADVSDIAKLEKSVKEYGIISPLEVIPFSPLGEYAGYYMILSGHRRRMAGRKVGMTEFPCIVNDSLKSVRDVENYIFSTNRFGKDGSYFAFNKAVLEKHAVDYPANAGECKYNKTLMLVGLAGLALILLAVLVVFVLF